MLTCTVEKTQLSPHDRRNQGKNRKMGPSAVASRSANKGHSSSPQCKYCLFYSQLWQGTQLQVAALAQLRKWKERGWQTSKKAKCGIC